MYDIFLSVTIRITAELFASLLFGTQTVQNVQILKMCSICQGSLGKE